MPVQLHALSFDTGEPARLGAFWAGVLGWELTDESTGDDDWSVTLVPTDDTGFLLRFVPSDEPKRGPNKMHFDLTSASLEVQRATVERALDLGGRHIDIGQLPEDLHVVLADPDGNEFCVIEPGNNFLSDCGFVGAVSSDGSQQVGYFWSKALDWPLVWDQDEETAIRSPHGGPKITWGGPPQLPKLGKNRLHFDLVASDDSDLQTEVARLVDLGAVRLPERSHDSNAIVLTDPDGNEFCIS